jgi:predicted DNA-binding ribbon-helix-helix protein
MDSNQAKGAAMKSLVVKRSIVVAGHKTSVSLEDAFWKAIKEIAVVRGTTLSNLVSSIDAERKRGNLSSGIRLFVLDFYRGRLNEERTAQDAAPVLMSGPPTGSV